MSASFRTRSKAAFSRLRLENLEEREVLANDLDLNLGSLLPSVTSFADINGDIVNIQLSGSTGNVSITSDESVLVNGQLDAGEQISGIVITNASANFVMNVTVDSTAGDGTIQLGNISSNRIIRGIYATGTAGADTNVQLSSFTGPGFSNGGGISVTSIVGNSSGVALNISGTLQQRTVINVAEDLTGDVRIGGAFGGVINVGGNVVEDGDGSRWTLNAATLNTGAINVGGDFASDLEARALFSGAITIGGAASGNFIFQEVAARARLVADSWANVDVNGNFAGSITARDGDLDLFVRNNVSGSISTSGLANLQVNGSVHGPARLVVGDALTATISGDLAGRITADGNVDLTLGRSMIGAKINSGGSVEVNAGGGINAKSNIQAQGGVSLTLNGGILDSTIDSNGSDVVLDVRTAVTNARIGADGGVSGTLRGGLNGTTIITEDGDLDLNITGNIANSRLNAQGAVMLDVSGSVSGTQMTSLGGDVSLTATGSVTGARIAADNVSLDVNGSVNSTRIDAVASISADINGSLTDSNLVAVAGESAAIDLDVGLDLARTHISTSSIDLVVGRHMLDSSLTIAGDIAASVTGNVTNSRIVSLTGGLELNVGGAVSGTTVDLAGDASVDINGGLTNSRLYIDGSAGTTLDILGNVSGSTIDAGAASLSAALRGDVTRSTITADGDITLGIDRSLTDTRINGGGAVSMTLGGSLTRSDIAAGGVVTIGTIGGMNDVDISTTDSVSLALGGNVLNSSIEAVAGVTANVSGNVTTTNVQVADGDVSLSVGGSFVSGSVQAGGNVTVSTGLDLGASIDGDTLDIRVGRDLLDASVLAAVNVADLNGDTTGLFVGRDLNGDLTVTGTLATGTTGSSQTVVVRDVGVNARLNINDIDEAASADELVFGGFFRGELNIMGDLDTDIRIVRDLAQASIGGYVNSDIVVGGRVNSFTSSSLFDSTGSASGDFVDATGSATGSLTAGSILDIDPLS